ncbi:hypothetical protein [Sphingomonas sp. RIT328]|uniref:hypothetical protein n=1 Tax=Sphingomonas sp. RIT328 TaxID=1470591 RepID=UPI00044C1BE3|nr:hypothetical protein [Sphingomonas sp. RIT328]EZP55148.1 hypothetical protein BW41_01160 [Sphingomonas sp. RIT328]
MAIVIRGTILLATLLAAQTPPAQPAENQVDAAITAYDKGGYLQATDMLAAAAFDAQGKVRDDLAYQMWEQVSTTVTNELDLATLATAQPHGAGEAGWDAAIGESVGRDAMAEIVRRARATSIVILNEAHSSPRDRAFAWRVAQALRPLGYTVLAAETFSNEPARAGKPTAVAQLARDGFARIGTGFYTRDPVYAAFLRNALAIGYQPAGYEQTSLQRPKGQPSRAAGIAAREQAEADNLAALHRRMPAAKLFVYVGHSHVAEAPLDEGDGKRIEWMAARLKRMTGIDPLTIDQTTLTEESVATRASYEAAAARVQDRDGILFRRDAPLVLGPYAGAVDLQVIHPRRSYRFGRPVWLSDLGGQPLAVPATLLPAAGYRLIQVFAASAPADAVPLDQIVVRAGSPPARLFAPPGPVRFAVQP